MKIRMKIDKKNKDVEVDFWDFFKGVVASYVVISIGLFMIGFLIGISMY